MGGVYSHVIGYRNNKSTAYNSLVHSFIYHFGETYYREYVRTEFKKSIDGELHEINKDGEWVIAKKIDKSKYKRRDIEKHI